MTFIIRVEHGRTVEVLLMRGNVLRLWSISELITKICAKFAGDIVFSLLRHLR